MKDTTQLITNHNKNRGKTQINKIKEEGFNKNNK